MAPHPSAEYTRLILDENKRGVDFDFLEELGHHEPSAVLSQLRITPAGVAKSTQAAASRRRPARPLTPRQQCFADGRGPADDPDIW